MSLRDPFKRGENWYCEVNRKRVSLKTKDKTEAMARFREIRKRYYEHLAGAPLVIEMTFGDFADEYEHWAEDAVESRKTLSANLLALHKLLAVVPAPFLFPPSPKSTLTCWWQKQRMQACFNQQLHPSRKRRHEQGC